MFTTINKLIACAPPISTGLKTETKSGFAIVQQKRQLLELEVIASNGKYISGTTIYVRGECIKHPFYSEIFEKDSTKFILVPEELIIAFDLPINNVNEFVTK